VHVQVALVQKCAAAAHFRVGIGNVLHRSGFHEGDPYYRDEEECPHHGEGTRICGSYLTNGTVGMSRRSAPVLVESRLRFVFSIAGLTYDDMFRLYVLQYELSVDNSQKKIAYLLQSGGVFKNPGTRCAYWMQSPGDSGML
jgi:hypothetical protein